MVLVVGRIREIEQLIPSADLSAEVGNGWGFCEFMWVCNFVLKTDFATVAKLGQVKSVKKSKLRQALRTKVNSMKFSASNSGYFISKTC